MFAAVVRRFRFLIGPAARLIGAEGGEEMDEGRIAAGGREMDGELWGSRRSRGVQEVERGPEGC